MASQKWEFMPRWRKATMYVLRHKLHEHFTLFWTMFTRSEEIIDFIFCGYFDILDFTKICIKSSVSLQKEFYVNINLLSIKSKQTKQ